MVISVVRDAPDLLLFIVTAFFLFATFLVLFASEMLLEMIRAPLFPTGIANDLSVDAVFVRLLLTLQSWKQRRGLILFTRSQSLEPLEFDCRINPD